MYGQAQDEEPRKPLKKFILNEKEISRMNKAVAECGLSLIDNMLDVENMLYAVGKTVEFF